MYIKPCQCFRCDGSALTACLNDKEPTRRLMHRASAVGILRALDIPLGADYHALEGSKVDELLRVADHRKYRRPKGANGSRARYFHAYLQRRAGLGGVR